MHTVSISGVPRTTRDHWRLCPLSVSTGNGCYLAAFTLNCSSPRFPTLRWTPLLQQPVRLDRATSYLDTFLRAVGTVSRNNPFEKESDWSPNAALMLPCFVYHHCLIRQAFIVLYRGQNLHVMTLLASTGKNLPEQPSMTQNIGSKVEKEVQGL